MEVSSPIKTDYLIVGQGIAGTMLAYFLEKAGKDVFIIDDNYPNSSTRLAGGLINPITGRRYVKTWLADTLIPFARDTYAAMEAEYGIELFRPKNFLRALHSAQEENTWLTKSADPEYSNYILDEVVLGDYQDKVNHPYAYGEVTYSGRTNFRALLPAMRSHFEQKGRFQEAFFDYKKIQLHGDSVRYEAIEAKKIIFCEGIRTMENPFFDYLPFNPTKGEVIFVKIPGVKFEKIYKNRIFMVPLPDDIYGVGATYTWDFKDDEPTRENRNFLESRLRKILKVPYEIIDHKAAIRPTVKDRRPFLGLHPQHSQLAIFNGLGTKGASLAPYFAKMMTDFLTEDKELLREVNIRRFSRQ